MGIRVQKEEVMTKEYPNCASKQVTKRGFREGSQRYVCKSCKKTFSEHKHSQGKKDFALFLYINSNGIRQISRILKVAPPLVRKLDIIELDEIYKNVKKNSQGTRMDCL
jgi:transposase-like protein